jgi:DNA-binding SARP family transcriptional activator/GTPase SAR1 family protein
MDFLLLGPVQAYSNGTAVDLGDRKQRLVLGVLLLDVNQFVSVDRLIRLLWPDRPPPAARRIVQTHVSKLRGTLPGLRDAAPEFQLGRVGDGYLLRCDPSRVDVYRFRAEVERARHSADDQERVHILRLALALWRGPALADVAVDKVRDELCGGLDESRLTTMEECFDAELRLGRQNWLVDDLTVLSARHPLRQRLVGQLMLALHRVGRSGDALRVYMNTRSRLAEELGLDPSGELQRLHLRILGAGADAAGSTGGARPTATAQLSSQTPGTQTPDGVAGVRPTARPNQLRADVPHFVGRGADLERLHQALATRQAAVATPLVLVTGMAGVGKTALVTRWAHGAATDYPDGQLYLDLRGHSTMPPLSTADALAAQLSGLGVAPSQVPPHPRDAEALYRSLLADRHMLVLLDDAPGPDLVRALMPGSSTCAVVVTSRDRMPGLVARDGAIRIDLNPLEPVEAAELIARAVRSPLAAGDAAAVDALARLCGGLPLAIRIAAEQCWDVAYQVEAMSGAGLMDSLRIDGDEDAGVPAAFGLSYAKLPPGAATMFRLLSVANLERITVSAAARLTGITLDAAKRALNQLVNANLARQHGADLFEVPVLLRRYAMSCLAQDDQVGP